jgi:hypothetical protein
MRFLPCYGNELSECTWEEIVPMRFQPVRVSLGLVKRGMNSRNLNGIGDFFHN